MIERPIELRFSGRSRFLPLFRDTVTLQPMVVAVACEFHGISIRQFALFDTGAEWSVVPSHLVTVLGFDDAARSGREIAMSTRRGLIRGTIEELDVRFPAVDGDALDLTVSFLVPFMNMTRTQREGVASNGWSGPIVLGWIECLELFRHALDPSDDSFYFGPLMEIGAGSVRESSPR